MTTIDYKAAGVDIEAGNEAVKRIKHAVESTFNECVLTGIGQFASMYDLKQLLNDYDHPVMVQSIDGVGTKMMVAKMMQKFDTIGIDIVSATTNDIIVMGAKPLTLLDYIANDKLDPKVIEQIVTSMAKACKDNDIALVGGETAEMPGTYLAGEHDLVGIVTGMLEKEKAILGKEIKPDDIVIAMPSSGLHTNGYSLARKLLFDVAGYTVDTQVPGLNQSIGLELLTPHINYTRPVMRLLDKNLPIKGMAHITGGGIIENLPRVLPEGCAADIHLNGCPVLPIFSLLTDIGQLDNQEAYRTFNMGIGYVMVIAPETLSGVKEALSDMPEFPIYKIGTIVEGNKKVRLV